MSPDEDWGCSQARGGAWGSRQLKKAGRGVPGWVPRAAGGQAQSRAGSCSRRGAGSGASTPPPAVMSAGPLLKGQAARRGSKLGLGLSERDKSTGEVIPEKGVTSASSWSETRRSRGEMPGLQRDLLSF